jgi:hypothetical protein
MSLQQSYWHPRPRPRLMCDVPSRDDYQNGLVTDTPHHPMTLREVHGNKAKSNPPCSRLKRAAQRRPQLENRPAQRFKEEIYNPRQYPRHYCYQGCKRVEPRCILMEPLRYPLRHGLNSTLFFVGEKVIERLEIP